MTVYVFLGPTLDLSAAREELDAVYLPPVSQGDVYRVARRRPRAIGIIDGRFHDVPAVWHKEILWAIAQGVAVYGGASMGALRAAELAAFGMRGVGWVFHAYHGGLIEADDEVAVAHSETDGYRATSVAMVDLRQTLTAAQRDNVIDGPTGAQLVAMMKGQFYPLRTWQALIALGRQADLPGIEALAEWLPEHKVHQKRLDALEVLRTMRQDLGAGVDPSAGTGPTTRFTFEHTQFFERLCRSAGDPLLDQGAQQQSTPVTLEDLLEELRLDPEAYHQVRAQALARRLALREAERIGRAATEAQLRPVAETFRRERQLYGAGATRRWLELNNLSLEQFSALVREEHALATIETELDGDLDVHMCNQLRVDGRYRDLTTRAHRKRSLLASHGLDDPSAALVGTSDEQLVRDFFRDRGIATPSDLDSYCRSLGYGDQVMFMRVLRREFWYREACRTQPSRDRREKGDQEPRDELGVMTMDRAKQDREKEDGTHENGTS